MASSLFMRDLMLRRSYLDKELFPELFLSLHTADPEETGVREVEGGGYMRQLIDFADVAPGTMNNVNRIDFDDVPPAPITHFGIWDAEGRFLMGERWTAVEQTRDLRLRPGELVLRIA